MTAVTITGVLSGIGLARRLAQGLGLGARTVGLGVAMH